MQELYAYVANESTQSQTVFWQKFSVYCFWLWHKQKKYILEKKVINW